MSSHAIDTERTPLLRESPIRIQTSLRNAFELSHVKLEGNEDPKNWSASRKWFCAFLVSVYALMGPVSSAMVVPALPNIAKDLDIENESLAQTVVSLFVLGWCLGPLFVAPCSEIFGRVSMLNLGHFLFLVANILCAVCTDAKTFLTLRFIAGFVGSAPLSLGGGIMSDLWSSEERGKSLAVYTVVPLSGPAVGAIFGGILVHKVSWRWVFWGSSIFTVVSLIIGLIALRETFAPLLLKHKREAVAREEYRIAYARHHRHHNITTSILKESEKRDPSAGDGFSSTLQDFLHRLRRLFKTDLKRPFILLFTQPIMQALALYMAYLFGLNYLSISTFQSLFLSQYHQSPTTASLNYLSIATGFILGCQFAAPLNDRIYAYLTERQKHHHLHPSQPHDNNHSPTTNEFEPQTGQPEFRVYLMIPASILLPIGLLIYGWSAQTQAHPLIPNLGILIYSFALIVSYQCIQAYALDCYPVYAASATGALSLTRCVGGFVFPILGPVMYRGMGYGWASTLLAAVALVLGGISPLVFLYMGPTWRGRSQYAAGDVGVEL